ncbi:glycosyltransferase family 4 protein [Shewanella nanhaiensis]|uniref:Glycosyltransferase family 4 protein n=1 Tax=Shewanella nanhaiensis TaxID=2864872 RepID=A0ABS7E0A3_9GAMM|nr:glycosyltransferase family 4 protein [Shewanella nanhaiensis]MBW8183093.1 glycosyltransferase family 4 protein [Shewanella nanhaiensis]
MRPRVLHLIDDCKLGGVNLALKSLCESRLTEDFEFSILHIDLASHRIKRFEADIIVLHTSSSWKKLPGFVLLSLKNRGIPILLQEHHYCEGFVIHEQPNKWRFFLMLRLSYTLMDRVLAVSAAQARWLLGNRLVNADKLVVLKQARPVNALLSLPEKALSFPIQLGAYGRLHKQKGFDLLLKAMEKLPAEKVELRLAGSGEMSLLLDSMAATQDNVTLIGEIEDVPQFLSSCDAVIIPSRWEPFGLICQESLAAGKAIVTSSVDGLPEQLAEVLATIGREDSSVLFTDQTVTALVGALECLISQAEHKLEIEKESCLSNLIYEERCLAAKRWPTLVEAWRELLFSEQQRAKRLQ